MSNNVNNTNTFDSNDTYDCISRKYDNRIDNTITEKSTKCVSVQTVSSDKHISTSSDLTLDLKENIVSNIYRYKFTEYFMSELSIFSKLHQYDERKDFKEAWRIWLEDNRDIVDEEIKRLHHAGFTGDIEDKMFKSARYYFRKKSTEKKEPAKRRIYVGSQKDLLEAMDDHIKSNINSDIFNFKFKFKF